jgi:putative NADPH-quinone reductase
MKNKRNNSEDLDAAYQEMAQDVQREAEALEWSEALIVDVGELAENSDSPPAE